MDRSILKVLFIVLWGSIFFTRLSLAQNVHVSDSLQKVLEENETSLSDSTTFYILVRIADNHPNPDARIEYVNRALELAVHNNNDLWKAHSYKTLGYSYKLKGDLHHAINSFYRSINYFQKANSEFDIASIYSAIGDTYSANQDHNNSILFYRKAIDVFRKYKDEQMLATVYINIGDEYFVKNQPDSALKYGREALRLSQKFDDASGIGYSLGNIGLVLARWGERDSAEAYIQKAIAILTDLGDRYPVSVFNNSLADIYKSRGDWDAALEYALNSLEMAKRDGFKEQVRDAALMLSEIYATTGNFESAYYFQDQFIQYKDSVNNDELTRQMADLRTEYELSQKQAEVDLLYQKHKMQSVINYSLAAVVVLLTVLALIVYRGSVKMKKVNQLLSDQKEEIAQQRDQMEELVKMKDRFFGIISHDLRSPVNSLQGITQLLGHYVKTQQIEEIKEFVALTDQSINNLSSLLDNLLGWALSQQGSMPYNPERFKLYYLAEEVRRIFTNIALSKGIAMGIEVSKDLEIWADRDSLFALVRNLINNAIKFTRKEGKVSLTAFQENKMIKLVVADTGVGIAPEALVSIFEMNQKKTTKGTAGERGSGLGLTLCKDIAKLNKGRIAVESESGKGTTISVWIPAAV